MTLRVRNEQAGALRKAAVAQGLVKELSEGQGRAEYDASRSTVQAYDAVGRRRRIRLNDSGFVEEIVWPSGRALKLTSDADGRIVAIQEPSGQQLSFEYGSGSQPSGIVRNGVPLCRFSLNQTRTQCAVRYWDSSTAQATFDDKGRPLQLTNRLGATDTLKYDAYGRLCELSNARGESTYFELNAQGLPSTTTHVDGRRESVLAYDGMCNATAVAHGGDLAFEAAYSAPGQATDVSYADGREYKFVRDDNGRILEASGPGAHTSYRYNDHGLPIEETNNGNTFRFEYDATDLLILLEYPDGTRVSFTYDDDKRVATCTDWSGGVTRIEYDAADRFVNTHTPNGITQRVILHSSGKPEQITLAADTHGPLLADSRFEYDIAQRLVSRTEMSGERRDYVYDTESQLVGVHSKGQWLEAFQYDVVGNRAASLLGPTLVERGNRVVSHGADTYEYDNRGNVSAATETGEAWRFEYDLRNQLVAAHGPSGTIRFEYDAFGRRITKSTDTRHVCYIWCGEQITQEVITSAQGVETRDYLYMPATYQPLATRVAGQVYFFHTNHQGTPDRISDATGQLAWSARYDAFGRAQVDVANIDNNLRFAGQYYDTETGLHYNRFRYYSPQLGRYCSVDPVGLLSEHNLYAYVGNDPINRVDPLGLWWKQAVAIAAGVAVAAAIVLTAPVSLPALAIGAVAVTVGVAVSAGVNEVLVSGRFCAPCLLKGLIEGAATAVVALGVLALAAEAGTVALAAATAVVVGVGVYSTLNLVFHWDNMTHGERMEAVGQTIGGAIVGLFPGGVGPAPRGFAWAETPGGGRVLIPVTEAAPVVVSGPRTGAVAMSGNDTGSGGNTEAPEDASEGQGELTPEQRDRLTRHPDAHSLDRHGGSVTDEQLQTRARTGVAPDGHVKTNPSNGKTVVPPESTAFDSDAKLAQAEQQMRENALPRELAKDPNATTIRIEKEPLGFPAGHGYPRIGPANQVPGQVREGPLQRIDNISSATGTWQKNPVTGEWEPVTIFPDQ